ncbi:MBL fold metallo-hydrolase [Pseudoalteromonas mariniglutinosa]|uniref:MBL fold metallo-hydrolase n=1 Tax=Pseudoalteromonas mariniglutinosa TaxID=206042 RepID=UPI00384BBF81
MIIDSFLKRNYRPFAIYTSLLFASCAHAQVTWHTITPAIQFLQQPQSLRFYDSNQVLIEGKQCALMLDASGDFSAVEDLAEQLKARLSTPLCYLVASHYHDDHLLGLAVLQHTFPDAKLIVHGQLAKQFAQQQTALNNKLDGYEKSIELSYQRLANLPAAQQPQWQAKLTLAKQRLIRWRKLTLNAPDIVINQPMPLDLGHYPLTITPYQAHTDGDLTITAEQGTILLGGDIVDWLPYPGHGNLIEWLSVLESITSDPTLTHILPGHGEPLTPPDLAQPKRFISQLVKHTKHYAEADLRTLISSFPREFAETYQVDEVAERAYPLFLEAGLKQAQQTHTPSQRAQQ